MLSERGISLYTHVDELLSPLRVVYTSLVQSGDGIIADGLLTDLLRRLASFGLSLTKLDIRQESDKHSDTLSAITKYLNIGNYGEWDEARRIQFCVDELSNKRPLIEYQHFIHSEHADAMSVEVLKTMHVIAEIGSEPLGTYIISMGIYMHTHIHTPLHTASFIHILLLLCVSLQLVVPRTC